jgi:hypothetical protein
MTQRKYREVTADDIGKMIEVNDDKPTVSDRYWYIRRLLYIKGDSAFPFVTHPGARWKYARIEVTDDPT